MLKLLPPPPPPGAKPAPTTLWLAAGKKVLPAKSWEKALENVNEGQEVRLFGTYNGAGNKAQLCQLPIIARTHGTSSSCTKKKQ